MPDGAGIGDLRQLSGAASACQQYTIVVSGASGAASARQQYAIVVPGASGASARQQYTIVVSDAPCVRGRRRS